MLRFMFCLLLNEGSVNSWGSLLARVFLCDVVACLLTLPLDTHSYERSCSLAEANSVASQGAWWLKLTQAWSLWQKTGFPYLLKLTMLSGKRLVTDASWSAEAGAGVCCC